MPAEKFTTPEINLLPKDDIDSRPEGKFLRWALSWGKKIVIITELVVVLAFLSRFKIDSDVANYSDEIERKKNIVVTFADFEKDFRAVSSQVNKIKTLQSAVSVVTILDATQVLIPQTIELGQIVVAKDSVRIEGSGDDQSLALMVAAFKGSKDFRNVVMDRVTQEGNETLATFSLSADYVVPTAPVVSPVTTPL